MRVETGGDVAGFEGGFSPSLEVSTMPGGVQKTCRFGILGHGLAGMVVVG